MLLIATIVVCATVSDYIGTVGASGSQKPLAAQPNQITPLQVARKENTYLNIINLIWKKNL